LRYLAPAVREADFGGSDPTLREGVVWFFREVARTVITHPCFDDVLRTAAGRNEPSVVAWLDAYLREHRTIFEWTDADAPGQVLLAAALVDCFDVLPEVFEAVEPLLDRANSPALRRLAASAAAMLVRHPDLAARRSEVLAYHLAECRADDSYHRASMVIGVGELGGEPRAWLDDPDFGVRVCAALAPALATDPHAVDVLVTASRYPHRFEAAFGSRALPQLIYRLPALVQAVCERVSDFERLLDSAIAAVPVGSCYLPQAEGGVQGALCEPYLRKAFPDGLPTAGTGTAAQRKFADAVAQHEPLWRDDAAWSASLTRIRLPLDRAVWPAFANEG
jgi:hypothetical protein